MPYFDDLMSAADPLLDALFAGSANYRPGGLSGSQFEVTADVRALVPGQDGEPDVPTSALAFAIELYWSEMVSEGSRWIPAGGDEVAFFQPDGTSARAYKVVTGPNGRAYENLDTVDRKLMVYAKLIRTET